MNPSLVHLDRRRSFRVSAQGRALLWNKQRIAGQYTLADVSLGGCMLRDGPPCALGADYGVVLDLDGEAMRLPAKLVRQRDRNRGQTELGLWFLNHPPWTEDRIQDLVLGLLERAEPITAGRVLVVDTNRSRRHALEDALSRLGCEVVLAVTPVSAVWELENGPMDFHTAFVARSLAKSDGRDLVHFIGMRYTGVWRVLLCDGAERHGVADALLTGPIDAVRLRSVMSGARLRALADRLEVDKTA